jgi:hypothetical protein
MATARFDSQEKSHTAHFEQSDKLESDTLAPTTTGTNTEGYAGSVLSPEDREWNKKGERKLLLKLGE